MRRKLSGRTANSRQPSAAPAAISGTRLTPAPAATNAKMLANWSLSKTALGVSLALRQTASAWSRKQ